MASFANTIINNVIDDYTKLNFINKLFFGAKEIKIDIWWLVTFNELLKCKNDEIEELIKSTNSYKRINIIIEHLYIRIINFSKCFKKIIKKY